MPAATALLQSIDSIYEAALDPSRWSDAVESFSDALGGLPACFMVNDMQSGETPLWVSARVDMAAALRFQQHYATVTSNPALPVAMAAPLGRSIDLVESVGAKRYFGSAYFNDVERPLSTISYRHTVAVREGSLFAGVAVFAPRGYREPTARETRTIEVVTHHFARALRLARRFTTAPTAADPVQAVLERLAAGVWLTDRRGQVTWHNAAAGMLMARGDGLKMQRGQLEANEAGDSRRLRDAFVRATDETIRISRPGAPPYLAHLHCLWPALTQGQPTIAVFVHDPEQYALSHDLLRQAFGLTAAEARIAIAVVGSRRIADVALCLGLSVNTVKSTLQRVFAKTSTHGQGELARAMLACVPGLRRGE